MIRLCVTYANKIFLSNLKGHLQRKHISVYTQLIGEGIKTKSNQPLDTTSEPGPSTSNILVAPNVNTAFSITSTAVPASEVFKQPAAKRQRLLGSYIRKVSTEQKTKIDRDLADLFIIDFQPFSIVEDTGFSKLMKWIPGYDLPSRKTISSVMIPASYHKCLEETKLKVQDAESVCITTDCWTSTNMAVTAHYISRNFELQSVLLKCSNFTGNHSAINLANGIRKLLNEWSLAEKVNFAVSDNASNITKAIEEILNYRHYGCYAHKVNLIAQNSLKIEQV